METDGKIKPEQVKAARALLRLEQEELARRAEVSVSTVRRMEMPGGEYLVADETVESVHGALREAGVEFIYDGVRKRSGVALDPVLLRDLRSIAEQSAAIQANLAPWTEADLYDEHGLPV